MLSEYLAERVAHLHVVEVDERLREALGDALAGHTNVSLRWADAMRLDLATLDPPPNKVVANLPYGIAAGFVLRSLQELPSAGMWVVMVQREVGERLAAAPGTGAYGLPSVLAQLAAEVRVVRTIPRSVFYPVPNVDSVLLRLERRAARRSARPRRSRRRYGRWWPPASPTGARRWWAPCGWGGGSAGPSSRRSNRSGSRPTCAPSVSPRSSSSSSPGCSNGDRRCARWRRRRSTSGCSWGPSATWTAGTSW